MDFSSSESDSDDPYQPYHQSISDIDIDKLNWEDLNVSRITPFQSTAIETTTSSEENTGTSENENVNTPKKILTRKRKKDTKSWKSNKRKDARNSGISYVNTLKKGMPAKRIRTENDCTASCRMKCTTHVTDETRKEIFQHYYNLDKEAKTSFVLATTSKLKTKRPDKKLVNSRRKFSFKYHFVIAEKQRKVCKTFYLNTLDISQQKVNHSYKVIETSTNEKENMVHGNGKEQVIQEKN